MHHGLRVLLMLCGCVMVLHAAETSYMPADTTSPELARLKSLAGKWTTTTSMFGKQNQRVYTEYQVTAGGSAVLERIFPGTPEEMMSVYYDDKNGKLAMTHYCIMRNRPQLALAGSDADSMTLDVERIDGLRSKKDPTMGAMTIRFLDKDRIETTCRGNEKGKQAPMTMTYTRVR